MMRRIGTLVLSICLLLATRSVALDPATSLKEYARTTWTEQEGLPSSLIWAITQDQRGYIWLGTDAGLIRFDGIRFVQVTNPALSSASVRVLLASRDGSLWIGLDSGSLVALRPDGHFARYGTSDGLPDSVSALLEDHRGAVWAGGRGGLSWLENGRWQRLRSDSVGTEAITSLFEDHEHTLWAATSRRLYRRPAAGNDFAPFASAFLVRAVAEDAAGTMWAVGTQQAIGTLSDSAANRALHEWRDVNGWRMLRDRQGSLWVATLGRGVLRLTSSGPGGSVAIENLAGNGLTSDVVRSLFEDREGNIWAGTQHGLNRFSDNTITTISSTAELSQPVRAVTSGHDGSVWVGTDNGLYQFTDQDRKRFDRRSGLPTVVIGALHVDRRGTLWVATDQGGLVQFDGRQFVPLAVPREARLRRVWAMTSDDEGSLWLCEVDLGLFRWKDGTLTSFADAPEIGRRFGVAAFTDRQGRVWIGFSDGTLVVRDAGRFRAYGESDGLPGGSVGAIYEDSRGTVWIGSANGLSRFSNGRFVTVTSGDGVAHSNVRAIVEDADHHLWIGARSGLVRFESDTTRYSVFDRFDGLRGLPMSVGGYPTAALAGDGSLWFVTSSGIAGLNPRRLNRNRMPPPIRIEQVIADDKPVEWNGPLRLPPLTSRIQIDYTGLSFTAPAKVHFRYILEGFDRDWVDVGTRRQAFYTNLPPRDYRFHVIADHDGVWNDVGAVLNFSIRPAFYQTKLFYVAVLSALALALLTTWRMRLRKVHRQLALVLAERTRVAREIHDTLLQSLVGVAFQFDAASGELDESVPAAKRRLERLRTQIELAIREARQSIWDLRSPTLKNRDLSLALRDAGKSIAGQSVRFAFSVRGRPSRPAPRVNEALLRIGGEAMSNAVRHARASHVQMELLYDADAVTLRVSDDGHGFDSEAVTEVAAPHWGLATMRERASQIGGRLTLTSGLGRGTQIEVVAPLGKLGVRA